MIKNYFKTTIRNIFQNKTQAFINIFGLSIGLASAILILLFAWYEFSYDKFHPNYKNSFRVYSYMPDVPLSTHYWNRTSSLFVPAAKAQFSEIKYASRLMNRRSLMETQNMSPEEENYYTVDSDFLNMFSVEFLQGDKDKALVDLHSIVISERIAEKYFSGMNPMGQQFKMGKTNLKVTGVFKNMPLNTHFRFDILLPFDLVKLSIPEDEFNNWATIQSTSYIQLNEGASELILEEKLVPFIKRYMGEETKNRFLMQPITQIHLRGNFLREISANGDIKHVMIFGAIGLFILLIASFNYMNLSTAQSLRRAKEVGLRKVIGAKRSQLVMQFLGESFLLTFISFLIALILIEIFIPYFNEVVNRELSFYNSGNSFFLLISLVCLIVALLSGSYPAVYLSQFLPIKVLKGIVQGSKKSIGFRNLLVVFQFVISVCLIICTVVVISQLNYIKNKELGYETKNILAFPLKGVDGSYLKDKLKSYAGIIDVTGSDVIPSKRGNYVAYNYNGKEGKSKLNPNRIYVDYNFLNFYNIQLEKGDDFVSSMKDGNFCLINQEAYKKMEIKDPIGTSFEKESSGFKYNFRIIGEFKNFHFASLHEQIQPTILVLNSKRSSYLSVKLHPDKIEETIAFIENQYNSLAPKYPFLYQFIEDSVESSYAEEQRLAILFNFFTILAVLIASLGLYGLVTFVVERRTKEIGIRKVLGASIISIVSMLTKYFSNWVLLANIIAWPIAWYFMEQWLNNFAYRIHLSLSVFVLAGVITFLLASLTAGVQSLKIALLNPVDTLKYE